MFCYILSFLGFSGRGAGSGFVVLASDIRNMDSMGGSFHGLRDVLFGIPHCSLISASSNFLLIQRLIEPF